MKKTLKEKQTIMCSDCIRTKNVKFKNLIAINHEITSPYDAIKYAQKCSNCIYDKYEKL